jgi:tripartite-type tricarboxylate transporter receptor subunit TctC
MKLPHRRKFLRLAAGAAALPTATRLACALDYPTRPVHLIEGFGAGSAPDIIARLIGQSLSERAVIRHREPLGRQQQYCHRGGRAGIP